MHPGADRVEAERRAGGGELDQGIVLQDCGRGVGAGGGGGVRRPRRSGVAEGVAARAASKAAEAVARDSVRIQTSWARAWCASG